MFDQLSYKKKNYGLAILAIILLYVVYSFALKNTFNLSDSCSNLENKLKEAENATSIIPMLSGELVSLNKVLNQTHIEEDNVQYPVLEKVSQYCAKKGIQLAEFPEPIIYNKNGYEVETNIVKVKGDFKRLLNLIYEFEQEYRIAKVSGISFNSKMNYRENKKELFGTIYLQNIKENKK